VIWSTVKEPIELGRARSQRLGPQPVIEPELEPEPEVATLAIAEMNLDAPPKVSEQLEDIYIYIYIYIRDPRQ
jgi:hypothetical protein